MPSLALYAGMALAIALLSVMFSRETAGRQADRHLEQVRRRTGVVLSQEDASRLLPIVARRVSWPVLGRSLVVLFSFYPMLMLAFSTPELGGTATYALLACGGFSLAATTGSLVGHLAAGLRSFPGSAGRMHWARTGARSVADFVSDTRLRAWLTSTLGLPITLVLDAPLLRGRSAPVVLSVVGVVGGALLLSLASWAVVRTLLGRPLTSGSQDELRCREALLADSLQLAATASTATNAMALVLGLGSLCATWQDLPGWGLPLVTASVAACVGLGGVLAWRLLRSPAPPALTWQGLGR